MLRRLSIKIIASALKRQNGKLMKYLSRLSVPDSRSLLSLIRAKFLILSLLIVFSASGLAFYQGLFSLKRSFLILVSLVLMHVAVNSLNSASDYRTGIDLETDKTAFSGGIDELVESKITYKEALFVGLGALCLSLSILVYFAIVLGSQLMLWLALTGSIIAAGYTDFFARNYMGELSAGIGLGSLAFFTVFYVQSGVITAESVSISVLMFVPVFNLLLMNEFPDIEADKNNGRKNVPILIGEKKSIHLYASTNMAIVIGAPILVAYFDFPLFLISIVIPSIVCLNTVKRIIQQNYNVTLEDMKSNVIAVHSIYLGSGLSLYLAEVLAKI